MPLLHHWAYFKIIKILKIKLAFQKTQGDMLIQYHINRYNHYQWYPDNFVVIWLIPMYNVQLTCLSSYQKINIWKIPTTPDLFCKSI